MLYSIYSALGLNFLRSFRLPLGSYVDTLVDWLVEVFGSQFDSIKNGIESLIGSIEFLLLLSPFLLTALLVAALAWFLSGRGVALFSILGLMLIYNIGLWPETMATLALILTATLLALAIAIPIGILAAKFKWVDMVTRPILDFMQTMPAFVYLLPAIFFFGIGTVSAVFATIIFAMPPAIRLTNLGIRQVSTELIEAGEAFGSNWHQMLFKVQLPLAMPTILAGVNQCIMLSLSMVVIASMIGAGGLGSVVRTALAGLDVGMGFEGGIAVVIIAIILDRLTQGKRK